MSGNPFRRTQNAAVRLSDEAAQTTSAPEPDASTPSRRKKKPKRVQIVSPHGSPTDEFKIPRRRSDGGVGSPPPESVEFEGSSDEDSSASADDDLDQALINTRRNSGSDPLSPPVPPLADAAAHNSDPPKNPFAKVGGTGGAPQISFGLSTPRIRLQNEMDEVDPLDRPRASSRPQMDVDTFKNMLLGHSATPSPPVGQAAPRVQDSSSSTDTSSISKHSLFEPAHGIVPESPRTSFDDRISDVDEESDDKDDSSLMGANRPQEIAPALPPKQSQKRPKGPQTVSFADFDETIPSPVFDRSSPETPRADPGSFFGRLGLEKSSSDLNKPLPAPPPDARVAGQASEPTWREPQVEEPTVPQSSSAGSPQPKKAAPPPPASRRQGPPIPPPGRNRARTNSSLDSSSVREQEGTIVGQRTLEQNQNKAAPPPPPSRRGQNASLPPASPPIDVKPLAQPAEDPTPSASKPPMPPPPPRRMASSTSKPGGSFTPNQSRQSLPRNESSSSIYSHGGLQAPPAPPPRRTAGGSSRSSIDGARRASGQSFGSVRSGSFGSSQNEPGQPSAEVEAQKGPPRDILADMDAFQKEIDALKAKALKGA